VKRPTRPQQHRPGATAAAGAGWDARGGGRHPAHRAESPGGWGTIAEVLRSDDVDPEVMAGVPRPEHGQGSAAAAPRGLSVDEDEELALAALKALPLLGTRAAGDALVEAYAATPRASAHD